MSVSLPRYQSLLTCIGITPLKPTSFIANKTSLADVKLFQVKFYFRMFTRLKRKKSYQRGTGKINKEHYVPFLKSLHWTMPKFLKSTAYRQLGMASLVEVLGFFQMQQKQLLP